jgi:MFS family permease
MSPFDVKNVRLFILFRVFFNARFYYPIFTILFLDFGLSLEQFAILNAAWAASIVLLEVPSGALADTIGRRNLLVCAGVLMVIEMMLLCFAPRGRPDLLFPIFLLNRVLSGAAEAAASGADEALAYDSLMARGDEAGWGRVLETQIRVQSMGYIVVMSVGAAVYDPELMQFMARQVGLNVALDQYDTLRLPLFLTLGLAVLTLLTTLRMTEIRANGQNSPAPVGACGVSIAAAFRLTFQAGGWILRTPFAFAVILAGLCFDHVLRMVVTLGSEYYRLISLPEASFGLIGSAMALLGLVMPRIARWLAEHHSPGYNFWVLVVISFIGLAGVARVVPIFGIVPMALLSSVMYMGRFFQSHYLNRITTSAQRATVLSFKGLSFNLAYGLIGIGYSLLIAGLRAREAAPASLQTGQDLETAIFIASLSWFPWYFLAAAAVPVVFACIRLKGSPEFQRVG